MTLAWDGIASRVLHDGEITLIIGGTGIKSDEAGYEPTDTDYRKGYFTAFHLNLVKLGKILKNEEMSYWNLQRQCFKC